MRPITIGQSITNRQDTSLNLYLKDVSKKPMISIDEEIELARRIKEGDNEALNKLVSANLRFAISIAKQYQNRGLSLSDLIQEASFGLIEAGKKFDETKGFKFISYAVWWIRQSILKALANQCRTVRVPATQLNVFSKLNKVIDKFEQQEKRKPSDEELVEETGLDYDKIYLATNAINSKSISLDSPFTNDSDSGSLIDVIPDDSVEDKSDEQIKLLNEILNNLSFRERDVIRMLFGIGTEEMENEEVACRFGISNERTRQIKETALEKLRSNYSDELKKLL